MNNPVTTANDEADAAGHLARPVEIDPAWCEIQHDGQRWREWQIRLPAAAALHDLNENAGLWRLVQSSGKALRRFDRVAIIAYDESWMAEAIVAGATGTGVALAGIRKIDLPPRRERLAEDDTYRVEWFGSGYALVRKADRLRVSAIVQTVQEAERELSRKYTRAA
jgi:hypothetical protein